MKKEKMLRAMDLIDEKYIAEADPTTAKRKLKHPKLIALAACFALLLVGANLWLFIPFSTDPPDVSHYSNSEYYPIIEKLNVLTYDKPLYKNNFDKLVNNLKNSFFIVKSEDASGSTVQPSIDDGSQLGDKEAISLSPTYEETTDNQVDGVIEGDLIKRSEDYIFYLHRGTLRVYSIKGEDSEQVDYYYFPADTGPTSYSNEWEMYLSNDCKTLTVITTCRSDDSQTCVRIFSLDVSDPTNVYAKKRLDMTGNYVSSRLVDGKLLLISEFYVGYDPDFSDESTFLPRFDTGDGMQSIPIDSIICPETLTEPRYTVVSKLDEVSLEIEGSSAFLSYSDEVYVSHDSVYATFGYSETNEENGVTIETAMTEISRLSYTGKSLDHTGGITVKGTVKNQYSLDEYNGILRVVTTTSQNRISRSSYGNWTDSEEMVVTRTANTNASLYCIDLATWEIVAQAVDFAPQGEQVESVRFDGDSAYVCTAVVATLTDPVFFFDLSDLDHITYKDTGVIEGYSSSLVNFGDGYLLGIGIGDSWDTAKIEIYEETENGVASVCSFEIPQAIYSIDYKAYLIDRAHQLVGFGIYRANAYYHYQSDEPERYVLFGFDNYELKKLVDIPFTGNFDYMRAVYIDDYLYMLSDEQLKVVKVGLSDSE